MKLHERLVHDLDQGQVRDGTRRYLLMRADVLMGAFDGLEPAVREAALQSLARSVARSGADSVRAYVAERGIAALLSMMSDAAASLGWGRWSWHEDGQRLELFVVNSPFAMASTVPGHKACHAIAGMLEAVATACWSQPAQAREWRCICEAAASAAASEAGHDAGDAGARGACHFVATVDPRR